jgi:hypothetical protein
MLGGRGWQVPAPDAKSGLPELVMNRPAEPRILAFGWKKGCGGETFPRFRPRKASIRTCAVEATGAKYNSLV